MHLLLLVFLAPILFFIWILWTEFFGAGWSPTPIETVREMLKLGEVGPNDILYDLGSGDGRIVTLAARDFGASAIGYEIDPIRFLIGWIRIVLSGVYRRATIRYKNFYNANLNEATVVTLFLKQETNENLRKKLEKELAPGSRVITYYWSFDKWMPIKYDRKLEIYLYVIGISDNFS
ncbi:MAG: SAM-dependent methyltransferase [bacterium]